MILVCAQQGSLSKQTACPIKEPMKVCEIRKGNKIGGNDSKRTAYTKINKTKGEAVAVT